VRETLWKLLLRAKEEDGQDLIEYALVVALVAFAATAGMTSLAGGINNAFNSIAGVLNSYIT
jgi:pilus assembly protein Flp/PilA